MSWQAYFLLDQSCFKVLQGSLTYSQSGREDDIDFHHSLYGGVSGYKDILTKVGLPDIWTMPGLPLEQKITHHS